MQKAAMKSAPEGWGMWLSWYSSCPACVKPSNPLQNQCHVCEHKLVIPGRWEQKNQKFKAISAP